MRFFDLIGVMVAEESDWGLQLIDGLKPVLTYIFAAIGAVAILFAIFLSFNLAKATDEAKRSAAKKRIINVVAGLFIIVILTTVLLAWDTSGAQKFSDYKLSEYSFSIDSMNNNAKKKIYLVRDGQKIESNMVFEQIAAHSNIGIDEFGTLSAGTYGSIKVNVYYEKDLTKAKLQKMTADQKNALIKLSNETITIRKSLPPGQVDYEAKPTMPDGTVVLDTNANFWNPVDYGTDFYGRNCLPHISSEFFWREPPKTSNGVGSNAHKGIDMRGSTTTTKYIYAASAGKVITAGYSSSAGNWIEIEHDVDGKKYYSQYMHLDSISPGVSVGITVGGETGQFSYGNPIGIMGNTGNSGGTHLHFGMYAKVDGKSVYFDPLNGSCYWNGSNYAFDGNFPTFFYKG